MAILENVKHYWLLLDGAESSLNGIGGVGQDTAASITITADTKIQLRLTLQANAGGVSADTYNQRVSVNGGTTTTITGATTFVQGGVSSNVTDGANTANRLTLDGGSTYSVQPGVVNNTGAGSASIALGSNNETELLVTLLLKWANYTIGSPTTLDFSVLGHIGQALTQLSPLPRLTVTAQNPPITGDLSKTLAGPTLVSTASAPITGDLAKTLSGPTLAATGSAPSVGTLAKTLAGPTLVATGSSTITATLAKTLSGPTLVSTAEVTGVVASTRRRGGTSYG